MAHRMAHDALQMIEYRDTRSVLVLADGEQAETRARSAAEAAGCRVSGISSIADGAERIDRHVHSDAVLVEIERDGGAALDRLLDRLDAAAAAGRYRSVVAGPAELVDVVAARTPHPGILHLVMPSMAERSAALALACVPTPARLNDVGKGEAPVLQQLSEEVGRIANILANLSEAEAGHETIEPQHGDERTITAASVRAIIRARRLRDRYFPSEMFADPAWDMLLDLMAARLDRQRVAVSSLCIAAAVPATTALRWIKTLTDQGLFVRTADPQDGRRVFIELSDQAASQLAAYLTAVQRISPLTI